MHNLFTLFMTVYLCGLDISLFFCLSWWEPQTSFEDSGWLWSNWIWSQPDREIEMEPKDVRELRKFQDFRVRRNWKNGLDLRKIPNTRIVSKTYRKPTYFQPYCKCQEEESYQERILSSHVRFGLWEANMISSYGFTLTRNQLQ